MHAPDVPAGAISQRQGIPFSLEFIVLAIGLVLVGGLRAAMLRVLFPAPLTIGIGYGITQVYGAAGAAMLTAIGVLIFLATNAYLYVRIVRHTAPSVLGGGAPSLAFTVLLAALSLRYWLWPIAQKPG